MPTDLPLSPGQYQIGDLKFGRGTVYPVTSCEIQGYDVNAQDGQLIRSDEVQFGFDSFKPAPIIFEMGVLDFRAIPNVQPFVGSATFSTDAMDNAVDKLATAWRGDGVRNSWGQMMPLRYCDRNGKVKVWYGRPRKFQATKSSLKSNYYTVHAEFQRADTLCYDDDESIVEILKSADPTQVVRGTSDGFAPSWLRIVGYGPLTHPVITVGTQQIDLDIAIGAGEAFEANSYPWSRRAILSDGTNVSAKLIGDTQYLDRLQLPAMASTPVRWTANELTTWVPALDNQAWSEIINDTQLHKLPNTFDTIHGKAVVRFDLFNFGGTNFPWNWLTPSKYIGSGLFGSTAAILYNAKKYSTADQYCEAKIVEPHLGRSAMVIMSNTTMTSFAMLEVQSGPFNNWLKIRTGTGWGTYSSVRASWQNTDLLGWRETDVIGFRFDSATKTYKAYLNGVEKCSWADSGVIVPTGGSNRSQGFIFDLDGNLITQGTGFKDILCYDRATVLAPVGQVFLLWRNAHAAAS